MAKSRYKLVVEVKMKEILEELKGSVTGIIGVFVIGGNGIIEEHNIPETMDGKITALSKTIYQVASTIKATKHFDRMIIESKDAKIIIIPVESRLLGVFAEKNLNMPLFKLVFAPALARIKESAPVQAKVQSKQAAPSASAADIDKICELYGRMFEVPAKKIAIILGPSASRIFDRKLKEIEAKHSNLFAGVKVGSGGRLLLETIKNNAKSVSKEELIAGLEDMLMAMVEGVRSTAGSEMAKKTIAEIAKIKEEHKDEI